MEDRVDTLGVHPAVLGNLAVWNFVGHLGTAAHVREERHLRHDRHDRRTEVRGRKGETATLADADRHHAAIGEWLEGGGHPQCAGRIDEQACEVVIRRGWRFHAS